MMKMFRLIVHQKAFSDEDVLISPKDCPEIKEGDIVEVYHPQPEEENPRLLLQIRCFKDDLQAKDTISIEQSIALQFGLRAFKDVIVRIVSSTSVALDSIELTFKDQYMGRSEMWRIKQILTGNCVYTNKKLELYGGAVRCQVYEMWSQGDRVACGVITDETKIVFRSSTSLVYLFIQMSSEMWDFDINGDLYFEKAVNGFLADLFQKWKKNGSNHEVTIVLFSRTFYEASCLEEFPEHMRECLQQDYRGRYYEDFYRVAVQNERYDDWSGILVQLRHLFSGYLKVVLQYHSRPGLKIPPAVNSTAAQGNFLEVLNISLNVFEKHYLDRSFDRTGQLSVVITPGVGIFEVDRELTNVTKQRVIDNGVGSDLVCVGEQPLHAVPLLKFHNKDNQMNIPDDYSMPHWINLSFYSTNKKISYSTFVPRIKLPSNTIDCNGFPKINQLLNDSECIHNTFFDYDAYDNQIFQLPPAYGTGIHQRSATVNNKKFLGNLLDTEDQLKARRKYSDPNLAIVKSSSESPKASFLTKSPKDSILAKEYLSPILRPIVGSAGSSPCGTSSHDVCRSKALINPFDPSHVTIKLTSNRRRWTHIFPKGPSGVLIQQHHYQAIPTTQPALQESPVTSDITILDRSLNTCSNVVNSSLLDYLKKRPNYQSPGHHNYTSNKTGSKYLTFLWGATGEQEWTPAITTGVDWKSLTIPACLPITTDYFPDKRALQIDYVVSLYNLLPDDVNADFAQQRGANSKKPLTTQQVFKELVSQRLAQGFQLILIPEAIQQAQNTPRASVTGTILRKRTPDSEISETYYLSIGRIFHKISLAGSSITVTRYRPRHPYPPFNIQYRYRFQAPYHDTYEVSWVSFTTEKLENCNWNYLDHYICTRGDTDFVLVEALKYWRFRLYLLPLTNTATKKIIEGASNFDIYSSETSSDQSQLIEGFLKFMETVINKIKRCNNAPKKARMSFSIPQLGGHLIEPRRHSMTVISQKLLENAVGCPSPFRERLGSNRLPDKPRPRSGSKVIDKGRSSPAVDPQQTNNSDSQSLHDDKDSICSQETIFLNTNATNAEILEAMKNPTSGVSFLQGQINLPSYTFVSGDAVHWLMAHVEGINTYDKAIQIMENLREEKLICHASGDREKQFVFGFYLFYVPSSERDGVTPLGDLQIFENEWLETEIRSPLNWGRNSSQKGLNIPRAQLNHEMGVPHFLCDDIDTAYLQGDTDIDCCVYKQMHLDIDLSNKSDRVEWGHAKYHSIYRPDQAYEIIVEWLVSSGSIVSELLLGWYRKAQSCGLQLVPIPNDPLALPYSNKSDPLRGPFFVPLNINCLVKRNRNLFDEFQEDTWSDRIFLFQEAIIARFGFIPCLVEPTHEREGHVVHQEHQYIHCTGTIFVLIPSPKGQAQRNRHRVPSISQRRTGTRYPAHVDVIPSPHDAYITRHVSGKSKDDYDNNKRMGFLWSWNHMVSKRWRTNQAVDHQFQVRMWKNFKDFCDNKDDRLRFFWEQSWEAKEDACMH